MKEYIEFLKDKMAISHQTGFEVNPDELTPSLYPHVKDTVRWAVSGGCRAIFSSFGMQKTVTQFYKEGKAMHHCVYANRYYRRSECLIMTAIAGEKHVETIEVNLKSFQIVQSRAVCNGTSEYHDRIIRLVEKNMSLIKKRIA